MENIEMFYQVTCRGEVKEFKEDTPLKEIALYFQKYYEFAILTSRVNGDFTDLSKTLDKDSEIEFFTRADEFGNKVYSKSARFILCLAVQRILGKKAKVIMRHSQDRGVYFTIEKAKITDNFIKQLNEEFQKIVDDDYKFMHLTVSRLEASDYFSKRSMDDKVNILKFMSNTYVNLYRLYNMYDFYYDKMAYSTKDIDSFKLYQYKEGFILQLPDVFNPSEVVDVKNNDKIYEKFKECETFGKSINLNNASDLNFQVANNNIKDIILMSEAYYNNQIANITDDIIEKKKKVVLLAGPSSSGKTTTANKISIYLSSKGYNTKVISIDDYFFSLNDRKKDIEGNVDFESINVVDTDLFNEQISKLLSGEDVYLSRYNFQTGKREFDTEVTHLEKNDIIVVEGLHALNDKLTELIDKRYKYKIYISPLTSLNIDNHNHVHTSDMRKLRRIIRDSRTRNVDALNTIKMWSNIRRGERQNIFPYQNNVDAVINSSLMYELGVLKTYALPLLYSVPVDAKEYPEALRLIRFLNNFLPIPSDDIPNDSVLREFIGGNIFKV